MSVKSKEKSKLFRVSFEAAHISLKFKAFDLCLCLGSNKE